MNRKISAVAIAVLGSVFAQTSGAEPATPSISDIESQSVEAAQVLKDLEASGVVRIDRATGQVQLKGSVLDVLRSTGWAAEADLVGGGVRTDRTF